MPVRSRAVIQVDRPERYLAQLCDHAEAIGHVPMQHASGQHAGDHGHRPASVERRDSRATLTFPEWGSCEINAAGDVLTLTVTGEDQTGVDQIQQVLGADLERFGRRVGVAVAWEQVG
jgi:hypothetical protein